MLMNALDSVATTDLTYWRRVSAVVDLVEIFEPEVQVCTWRRPVDLRLAAYLSSIAHLGTLQILETLRSSDRAKLDALPAGEGREQLVDDVAFLTEMLCELLDCSAVGFRGTRIEHAMCPKWHIDRVPIRMLCTYEGPGTEWLEDQGVSRSQLSDPEVVEAACQRAVTGEVVLLKGSLWQDNEAYGAIHRSPSIDPGAGRRTMVSLDPLWAE